MKNAEIFGKTDQTMMLPPWHHSFSYFFKDIWAKFIRSVKKYVHRRNIFLRARHLHALAAFLGNVTEPVDVDKTKEEE